MAVYHQKYIMYFWHHVYYYYLLSISKVTYTIKFKKNEELVLIFFFKVDHYARFLTIRIASFLKLRYDNLIIK